jgi:hypothetical protein
LLRSFLSSQRTLFSDLVAITLSKVKTELNLSLRQIAEFAIRRVRLNHYVHGNRPSRLLANKVCSNDQLADIATIESETGKYDQNPNESKILPLL